MCPPWGWGWLFLWILILPGPSQVLQLWRGARRLQEAGPGSGCRVQGQLRVPGRGRAAAAQGTAPWGSKDAPVQREGGSGRVHSPSWPCLPNPPGSRWESRRDERASPCPPVGGGGRGPRCSSSAFKGSSASATARAQGPASKQPISFEVGLSPGVAQARRTRGWSERNAL